VRLSSFSYRRGYPDAFDEHGGGCVFDCRALPNPGREEKYHLLTGLDAPVQEHLQQHPEVRDFWDNTRSLVEAQVENYQIREFQSLAVAYGCTGGQHRSVYFAERMAAHLRERFPGVQILVNHRERVRWLGHSGTDGDSDWTQ
jgi:RNase adaptor protein for sRNA GlmZ degradation